MLTPFSYLFSKCFFYGLYNDCSTPAVLIGFQSTTGPLSPVSDLRLRPFHEGVVAYDHSRLFKFFNNPLSKLSSYTLPNVPWFSKLFFVMTQTDWQESAFLPQHRQSAGQRLVPFSLANSLPRLNACFFSLRSSVSRRLHFPRKQIAMLYPPESSFFARNSLSPFPPSCAAPFQVASGIRIPAISY